MSSTPTSLPVSPDDIGAPARPTSEPTARPLATLSTLPRHAVALAAIAATIGSMVGYDAFSLRWGGWGSALAGTALGAMIGCLAGIGVMSLSGRRSGMLADEFPHGHMMLVVSDDALDVHTRSPLTGRPRQRLVRYGRHQITAVGYQRQLLTTTLAIRFADGSTLFQDAARWARVGDFVDVLTG